MFNEESFPCSLTTNPATLKKRGLEFLSDEVLVILDEAQGAFNFVGMGLICYLIQRGLHGLLYGKIAFLSEFEPWEQCFVTFALVPQWAKIKRGAKIKKIKN